MNRMNSVNEEISTDVTRPGRTLAARIDQACDRFESALRSGEAVRIEAFLAEFDSPFRGSLFHELLILEVGYRRGRGDQPSFEEYRRRFPERTEIVDRVMGGAVTETIAADAPEDTIVSTSRFTKLRFLDSGGLGEVFTAEDALLKRDVALKFIQPRHGSDPACLGLFLTEAEITGRLDHPGVVPVYGMGETCDGRPFYAMRLVQGTRLREEIEQFHKAGCPRLDLHRLLSHLVSVCHTVAYAHNRGIVHRDIKPENIMIGRFRETTLLDWGLAIPVQRDERARASGEKTMLVGRRSDEKSSVTGAGTLGYMSPEQLPESTSPIGPASDVYSLGATLYKILTGETAFHSKCADVWEQIRQGQFPRPRQRNAKVPLALEAICLKAMATNPRDRYPGAMELAADLQAWMADSSVSVYREPWLDRWGRWSRRHRKGLLAGMLAFFVATVATSWIAITSRKNSDLTESVESALTAMETLCEPLANDETGNLIVFRPLADNVGAFAGEYLSRRKNANSDSASHIARVHEIQGTVDYYRSAMTKDIKDTRASGDLIASALKHYAEAEQLFQQADEGQRLAQNLLTQGRWLAADIDLWPEAASKLKNANGLLADLLKEKPDDARLKRQLAESFHVLGDFYAAQSSAYDPHKGERSKDKNSFDITRQNLLTACHHYQESLRLRQDLHHRLNAGKLTGLTEEQVVRDLARSSGYLGDVQMSLNDIEGAQASYKSSLAHRKSLYQKYLGDPEQSFQYARGLANFGYLARDYGGDAQLTISNYLAEAAQIQQGLVARVDHLPYKLDLAGTQLLMAELYLFSGLDQPERAGEYRTLAQQQIAAAQVVLKSCKGEDPSIRSATAQCHVLQAIVGENSATDEAKQGKEILTRDGRDGWEKLDDADLFTYALASAVAGENKVAIEAINLAIASGNNNYGRLERHRQLGFQSLDRSESDKKELDNALQKMRE